MCVLCMDGCHLLFFFQNLFFFSLNVCAIVLTIVIQYHTYHDTESRCHILLLYREQASPSVAGYIYDIDFFFLSQLIMTSLNHQ